MFQSFFMGGFECATHRRQDGLQIDVLTSTRHAAKAEEDYHLLQKAGIKTVRDGMRWHLIEREAGVYDWSSFLPMLDASIQTGTQVIWDLCHWGIPNQLDVFSEEFVVRFAAFAAAAAEVVLDRMGGAHAPVPFYCPINEVSFWSWVGGDVKTFAPHREGQGPALKLQLVRASLAAMAAIRAIEPRARFVQAEPVINIVAPRSDGVEALGVAEHVKQYTAAQYEVWDMLRGDAIEELGGAPEMLDVIGVNYYWNNQWVHEGDRTPPGHADHRPLHVMLRDLWERYRRPIVITETGAEAGADVGWLGYIAAEIRQAQRTGVQIVGICLYPVMDYPGWDDDRHCSCGLIEVSEDWASRSLRKNLVAELQTQAVMMGSSASGMTEDQFAVL